MTAVDQSALNAVDAMIESQLRVSKVSDERVIGAIRQVDRSRFVPTSKQVVAYADANVPLLPGRAMMQPMVLGRLIAAVDIGESDKVLIVGGATGYSAAVIARLAGQVIALEEDEGLAGLARANLQGTAHVSVVTGALAAGYAAQAPYDHIFIDGGVEFVPPALIGQLSESGVMSGVIIDQGVGRGFTARRAGNALGINPFMDGFVPVLPGFAKPLQFTF